MIQTTRRNLKQLTNINKRSEEKNNFIYINAIKRIELFLPTIPLNCSCKRILDSQNKLQSQTRSVDSIPSTTQNLPSMLGFLNKPLIKPEIYISGTRLVYHR